MPVSINLNSVTSIMGNKRPYLLAHLSKGRFVAAMFVIALDKLYSKISMFGHNLASFQSKEFGRQADERENALYERYFID